MLGDNCSMRLRKVNGRWTPFFTVLWEVEALSDAGDAWLPFALPHTLHPLGEIHALTHTIRFTSDEPPTHNIIVTLLPPHQ